MAVYTRVDDDELEAFLAAYDLGEARAFKGIAEGVENSNFYLETTTGRYILTLFEKRANPADLPWFIALKQHLSARGYPAPDPIAARDGEALRQLAGKPAVIVSFLDGLSPRRPNAAQCRAAGAALARMHAALEDFPERERPNDLGPAAWPGLWRGRAALADELQPGLAALIEGDLAAIAAAKPAAFEIPRGVIHADLFPDNTFFIGNEFTGAFDFYFACNDALAYDLAICLNAWAFEGGAEYNYSKGAAMVAGYESVRRLTKTERSVLPELCLGAAMRFFLTRLVDWAETPADALVRPHDPLDYAARLAFHRKAETAEAYGA
ncbi:MAG: homoserine kinase [Pseudomonadota bacterium]